MDIYEYESITTCTYCRIQIFFTRSLVGLTSKYKKYLLNSLLKSVKYVSWVLFLAFLAECILAINSKYMSKQKVFFRSYQQPSVWLNFAACICCFTGFNVKSIANTWCWTISNNHKDNILLKSLHNSSLF